jgi:hypothetical protein
MSVPQRLVAFAVAVVLAFGAGYGIGDALDPVLDDDTEHPATEHPTTDHPTTTIDHGEHAP